MKPAHLLLFFAALPCCSALESAVGPAAAGDRVGVYDGRAVVIAYANSARFDAWMKAIRAEFEEAKAKGDVARAEAIEARVVAQQRRFHGQAFEGDDVDDVLEVVAGQLDAVCQAAGVDRLERVNLQRPPGVVTVDVTDRLIELFDPDEKGRRWAADVRGKPFR